MRYRWDYLVVVSLCVCVIFIWESWCINGLFCISCIWFRDSLEKLVGIYGFVL